MYYYNLSKVKNDINIFIFIFQHGNWRCVSQDYCSKLKYYVNVEMINQERPYKVYDRECLETCPKDTEEKIEGNVHTCKKCTDCSKECSGNTIRSIESLRSFEGCTRILGDLTIQINGSKLFIFLF